MRHPVDLPAEPSVSGVVVLHGSESGDRDWFLYAHLARLLTRHGVAVLRYDRRPGAGGRDVPLDEQAGDAIAAMTALRVEIDAPVGLWGYSQGAWAAQIAAVRGDTAFVICVSGSGVSPSAQMRYGVAEHLRRLGFAADDVAAALEVRAAVEACMRGPGDPLLTAALLSAAEEKPWFAHAYLPADVPVVGSWADMDFDPLPWMSSLRCPVLATYGETDEWVPVEQSMSAWSTAREHGVADLSVVRIGGTDHVPTVGGDPSAPVSEEYADTLLTWLRDRRFAT